SQDFIGIAGTLRYKPRPFSEKGVGLVLEKNINLEKTSKLSIRQPEECASELPSPIVMDPMDEDMIEGVVTLAETLQTDLLDVQADAASAIAGLTSD
ncbi:unnamed protein product, partial [Ascophyllum nodosum]